MARTNKTENQPREAAEVATPLEAKGAFAKMEAKIRERMSRREPRPRFDARRASSMALGTAARVAPLRAEIVASCKLTDIRVLDDLRDLALAAWHTLLMDPRAPDTDPVPPLVEEAKPLREALLRAAELLAHFGLMDGERVAEIRAGVGFEDMAADLVQLSDLFERASPEVVAKTPVDAAMIARAGVLGSELKEALARRADEQSGPNEVLQLRAAALNLLTDDYRELRRALRYLKDDEEAVEALAPTFFAPRVRVSRSVDPAPEDPAPAPEDPTPGSEPRLVAE